MQPVRQRFSQRFSQWFRTRPAVGGLLVALSGVELFFSGQLDIGTFHVQLGIEGLQATIVPIALVALGVLAMLMPVHHVFYGVIALALAVYSLIGVNLGGFIIGMLLGAVGGVLVVAWMPRKVATDEAAGAAETDVAAASSGGSELSGDEQDGDRQNDDGQHDDEQHDDEGAHLPLARGRQ